VPLADSNLPPSLFLNTLRESLLSPRAPARKVRRRSQTAHPPFLFPPPQTRSVCASRRTRRALSWTTRSTSPSLRREDVFRLPCESQPCAMSISFQYTRARGLERVGRDCASQRSEVSLNQFL
jgi:hypothetical protein